MNGERVFLALSGGAARSLCHIYMLDYFKQHDFKIDGIVGTSAGSIVAGLHAYGMNLDEMENTFKNIENLSKKFWKFISLKNLFFRNGFFKTKPLFHFFNQLFNKAHIENLNLPFGCVTYDLDEGAPYYIKRGNLASAITYSITFPILFAPEYGSLVDGGLSDNCPAQLARELGATKVISIDLHRDLDNNGAYKTSKFKTIKRMIRCLWNHSNENNEDAADLIIRVHSDIGFFGFDEFGSARASAKMAFDKNFDELENFYNSIRTNN